MVLSYPVKKLSSDNKALKFPNCAVVYVDCLEFPEETAADRMYSEACRAGSCTTW